MKTSAWRPIVATLAGIALLMGTAGPAASSQEAGDKTTFEDVKQQLADAARAVRDYSADQRDEAVKKTKAALDVLDARVDRLEKQTQARWAGMDEAAREKAAATLEALRRQRNAVAEWYGGLKHSSQETWERTKQGFSDAYEALKGTWEKAEKDLDPNP